MFPLTSHRGFDWVRTLNSLLLVAALVFKSSAWGLWFTIFHFSTAWWEWNKFQILDWTNTDSKIMKGLLKCSLSDKKHYQNLGERIFPIRNRSSESQINQISSENIIFSQKKQHFQSYSTMIFRWKILSFIAFENSWVNQWKLK